MAIPKPNSMPLPTAAKPAEVPPVESLSLEAADAPPLEDEKAPEAPKVIEAPKPIHVRANRPGFFGGDRKVEGDLFTIPSEQQLGEWMDKLDI